MWTVWIVLYQAAIITSVSRSALGSDSYVVITASTTNGFRRTLEGEESSLWWEISLGFKKIFRCPLGFVAYIPLLLICEVDKIFILPMSWY